MIIISSCNNNFCMLQIAGLFNRLSHVQFKKGVDFMKRLILFSLFVVFLVASATAYAAEKAPLGEKGHIALKFDYIAFTESRVDKSAGTSFLAGLMIYFDVTKNLYLGGEFGYTFADNSDVKFVPLELNAKYAVETSPNVVIDLGAGLSMNYVERAGWSLYGSSSYDDWLFGGQFFAGISYATNTVLVGFHGKYQITDDFGSYNYNNWRAGLHVGIPF